MSEFIAVGTVLSDRYEILENIGSGGMAHVYKAHCRKLNRNVAIKVLRSEFTGDEAFVHRFETEAQAAAAISHANIVAVYDVGSSDGLHYIVMELLDGITLKEYIEKHGALEWKQAVQFELQICAALECAHKHNIIHHDIKPQNMMITEDGTLKVTDFGIARATGSSTTLAGEAGGALGSVHYCSPEQARGGFTDEKSDLYSAGVVLYEMLTGKVPFDAEMPVAVAMKHMNEELVPVTEQVSELPADLDVVISKTVNRERRNRYASATEMIGDLEALLQGESVEAIGDTEPATRKRRGGASGKTKGKTKLTKSDIWIILGSVFCALALVFGVFALFMSSGGQRNEVQVPNVLEMTQEEAEKVLKKSKLKMDVEEVVYDTKYEEGIVIEQNPVDGKIVQKGFRVKVRVSGGAPELKIPNVLNMPEKDAVAELESCGFKVIKRSQYSENVPKNAVVRQNPEAGEKANQGDTVTIYVNDSAEEGVVPDLSGLTVAVAKSNLEAAGFKLGTVTEEESGIEKGLVIRQSPVAGTPIEKGDHISLVISAGNQEAQTETPNGGVDAPAQEPAEEVKIKTISVPIPQDKEVTHVRIVANGTVIHDATHSKTEGTFDLRVTGKKDVQLEIYHDGAYKGTQKIYF